MKSLEVRQRLQKLSSEKTRIILLRFFKTGPGQYGEGDDFLGIKIPPLRALSKELPLDFSLFESLMQSRFNEERLLALFLAIRIYRKAIAENNEAAQGKINKLFLKHLKHVNNWNLVDLSAPYLLGPYYQSLGKTDLFYRQIKSKNLWTRRVALLSSFAFLRQGQYKLTADLCRAVLTDKHDLIHKASGWMLREAGKRDLKVLLKFLDKHSQQMPRTMLRYSIEKLNPKQRKHYMTKKEATR